MVLCALNYAISHKGNFKMCEAILITHLLFRLFTLLASFKKNTNFHVLFLSSTKLTVTISLTIQFICLFTQHHWCRVFPFLQKCRQHFLHDTYILCKLQPNTAEQQTSLTCTGLLCVRDNTQFCECIKFRHR